MKPSKQQRLENEYNFYQARMGCTDYQLDYLCSYAEASLDYDTGIAQAVLDNVKQLNKQRYFDSLRASICRMYSPDLDECNQVSPDNNGL